MVTGVRHRSAGRGRGPVSIAAAPARRGRRRWLGAALALLAIGVFAVISAYLTAPRPGGRMDPGATSPDGAHALVALLRDRGVQVTATDDVDVVAEQMTPDTLLLVAETQRVRDSDLLHRMARLPGDRLLVEPTRQALSALAPTLRRQFDSTWSPQPDCALREANRAGTIDLGSAVSTYRGDADAPVELTRCYGGALVRYTDDAGTTTVVGSAEFLLNANLLREGNAALAMNLAGAQPRVIWFAPQRPVGLTTDSRTLSDLIPRSVTWVVLQLGLAVVLAAFWKARRLGPLVAEKLPVVVRASETAEGRGRLYRALHARDRAAEALRTATLQRLRPRLGLGAAAAPPAVVDAVSRRSGVPATSVQALLFGPLPATDPELLHFARALDDIERQVTHV